jgi:ribonuclease P/MRP protein subunit POP5
VRTLPKHLRPRWRYLGLELETWPDADLSRGSFQRAVWYAAQNLLGDVASADADLSVLRFRHGGAEGEAIVRARRGAVDRARAIVACVDRVGDAPVGVRVRGVSGTVRACEERYLRGATRAVEQRDVAFDGGDRGHVRGDAVDVRLDADDDGAFAGATALDLPDSS